MNKALNILVTRPQEDAEITAEILRKHGMTPIIAPMMEIVFQDNNSTKLALEKAVKKNPQAILVTSANSVRAVRRLLDSQNLSEKILDIPLVTVGEISAGVAKNLGFTSVSAAGGDVENMVRYVAENYPTGTYFLHIAGSVVAGDLQGELENKGFTVDRVVLYEARAVEKFPPQLTAALLNCELDIALFYSPRTARIFTELAKKTRVDYLLKHVKAVALSEAVAEELHKLKWAEVLIAPAPDQESVISLITRQS